MECPCHAGVAERSFPLRCKRAPRTPRATSAGGQADRQHPTAYLEQSQAQLCNTPFGAWYRHPLHSGIARPRQHPNNGGLHTRNPSHPRKNHQPVGYLMMHLRITKDRSEATLASNWPSMSCSHITLHLHSSTINRSLVVRYLAAMQNENDSNLHINFFTEQFCFFSDQ